MSIFFDLFSICEKYYTLSLEILARHFLPQIQAYFESKEGRKEDEEWKAEQAALKVQTADKTD